MYVWDQWVKYIFLKREMGWNQRRNKSKHRSSVTLTTADDPAAFGSSTTGTDSSWPAETRSSRRGVSASCVICLRDRAASRLDVRLATHLRKCKRKKSKEQDLCDQFILFPHVYFFFLEKYRSFFIRREKEKSILHTRSDKEKKSFYAFIPRKCWNHIHSCMAFFIYTRRQKEKKKKKEQETLKRPTPFYAFQMAPLTLLNVADSFLIFIYTNSLRMYFMS